MNTLEQAFIVELLAHLTKAERDAVISLIVSILSGR